MIKSMLNNIQIIILEELSKTELPDIQAVMLKSGAAPTHISLDTETIQIQAPPDSRSWSGTIWAVNLSTNEDIADARESSWLGGDYYYLRNESLITMFNNSKEKLDRVREVAQAIATKGFVDILDDI